MAPGFQNNTSPASQVISAFAAVARPVILRYFPRRSCIASCRIAIECLRHFRVTARPQAVRFVLSVPALRARYISGVTAGEKEQARRTAECFHELPNLIPGMGWDGHLIVRAAGCLIDPSFDAGFEGMASRGLDVESSPLVAVLPLGGAAFDIGERMEYHFSMDDGINEAVAYYDAVDDSSFAEQPAWELDHLEPVIRMIISEMRGQLCAG